MRILHAANQNLFCIRTQIDKFDEEDSLKSALEKDRQILKNWGINATVLSTSSKNQQLGDYQVVKNLMDS